jgi:hypothetical protein
MKNSEFCNISNRLGIVYFSLYYLGLHRTRYCKNAGTINPAINTDSIQVEPIERKGAVTENAFILPIYDQKCQH